MYVGTAARHCLSREWWEGRSEVGSLGPVQQVLSASVGPRKMLGVPWSEREAFGRCGVWSLPDMKRGPVTR